MLPDRPDAAAASPDAAASSQPDPMTAALLEHLQAALASFGAALDGLTTEELNRAPAPETNSIAVLVAHTVYTARSILHDLVDEPLPRDREAAFRLTAASGTELQAMLDACAAEIDGLVARAMALPLDRPITRFREASQAWWLLQVLAHTREHAAHAALTRQLIRDMQDRPWS